MVDMAATFDGQPWETLRRAGKVAVRTRRARHSPFWSAIRTSGVRSADQNGRKAVRQPGTIARSRDDVLHSHYGTVDCRSTFSSGRATVRGRRLGITVSDGTPAGAAVDFQTSPEQYRHWRLSVDGPVATLTMAGRSRRRPARRLRAEAQLLRPRRRHRAGTTPSSACASSTPRCTPSSLTGGARQGVLRRRQHPDAGRVVARTTRSTSASSPTRPATASRTPRRTPARSWIAAVNGTAAGGGYELALACDEIVLIDDRASAVSLPEVPLLAVLPGTGGLTRVVDKRHVRRDLADVFATRTEGVKGRQAVEWGLVDASRPAAASPRSCASGATDRAGALRPARPTAPASRLDPLDVAARRRRPAGYEHVEVAIDRELGAATITVHGPAGRRRTDGEALVAAGAVVLAARRAPASSTTPSCDLRFNEPEVGTWVLHDPRRPGRRARRRRPPPRRRRPLAGPRGPPATGPGRSSASTSRPARSSRCRAGQLLRRHAGRAGPGRRPLLHARRRPRRRRRRPRSSSPTPTTAGTRWSNGLSRLADPLLGPRRRARRGPRPHRQGAAGRRTPPTPAW